MSGYCHDAKTDGIIVKGNYVFINGVKVARRAVRPDGTPVLHFPDKDRRRCAERGQDYVEATIPELQEAVDIEAE
jgi:hypothetical protein